MNEIIEVGDLVMVSVGVGSGMPSWVFQKGLLLQVLEMGSPNGSDMFGMSLLNPSTQQTITGVWYIHRFTLIQKKL